MARRWSIQRREPRRDLAGSAALVLAAAALPLGLVAERVGAVAHPALDLAAGLAMALAAAILARRGQPRAALALALVPVAWFAGTAVSELAYLHRLALAYAIVAAPGLRVRDARGVVAVLVAGTCALPWDATAVAALVTAAAVVEARPRSAPAWVFAAALGGTAALRAAVPDAHTATLVLYDVAVTACALVLAASTALAPRRLAGRVVDLGSAGGLDAIAGALGEIVGDAGLRVGRWSPTSRRYVDDQGRAVAAPADGRLESRLDHDGAPVATVHHLPGTAIDRRLRAAVVAAVVLLAEHARLQDELATHAEEVDRSRRRLLDAADRQRGLLARRVAVGPVRRLRAVEAVAAGHPPTAALLAEALDDLVRLAVGLLPDAVATGDLGAALSGLTERSPVAVDVDVAVTAASHPLHATAYLIAGEAIANAVKHAGASRITVLARERGAELVVEVSDDGCGGADAGGSGLRGIADRAETLGGSLTVTSGEGGTLVRATLPLACSP